MFSVSFGCAPVTICYFRKELFNEKLKIIENVDPIILTDFLNQHEDEIYMKEPVKQDNV